MMGHSFYGIDHVQLAGPAGCEEEARRFFGDMLGLEEMEKPEALKRNGGVWFRCGAHQVHIGIDKNFVPAKKAHPAIHVRNLAALKEKLVSDGISIRDDDLLPVADRFYVDDPFGNRIEFLEWKE